MEIYQALKKDHEKVKSLLKQLVSLKESEVETRNELVDQIRDELVPHSRAEEAVFYNSLRMLDASKSMAMHGFAEHLEAEAMLRTLQAMDAIGTAWRPVAYKLKESLEHHIEEEEGEMFTAGQQLFTSEEAEAMGVAFENMKPAVKEGGIINSSIDMVANMLPPSITERFRNVGQGVTK